MADAFRFHQFFGNRKLEFINSFESPYFSPGHMIYEEISTSGYALDSKRFCVNSDEDLKGYADNAHQSFDAPVELERIICVINHGEFDEKYRNETLVFYEDGLVIRTTERSRDFMNRVFRHAGMSYPHMREVMKYMNGHSGHNCPYVQGRVAFMPIGGPSKKDVSWISLSHLLEFREHPHHGHITRFEFFNRHFFDFQITLKTFEKRMEPAVQMYAAQHKRLMEVAEQFDMDVLNRSGRATKNVLHKGMLGLPLKPTLNELALAERMMGVTYRDWKKQNASVQECTCAEALDKLFLP